MLKLWCREYELQRDAHRAAREAFRREVRARRAADSTVPLRYNFPPHLHVPFPALATWIHQHISGLRQADFPVPMDLLALSLPLDAKALSYSSMWAYGAHFRTEISSSPAYVTFDSRIAHITKESLTKAIDVGVLKAIYHVRFGAMTAVLMKGEWYAKTHQGRSSIKKDRYGFWTVKATAKEDWDFVNPFAYPEHISQVFFMADKVDPDVKVVIRSDVRSVRIVGERELPYFGASGSEDGNLTPIVLPNVGGDTQADEAPPVGAIIREELVQDMDATIRAHAVQNDDPEEQFEDEFTEVYDNFV